MKKFSCLAVYLVFLLASCGNKNDKKIGNDMMSAQIVFADSLHDFGSFPATLPYHEYDFKYTNVGDVPAVILHAVPSCKCTSVKYSKEPVMPGHQGNITVVFDGKSITPGYFYKTVKIRFNSPQFYNLRIRGEMSPPIYKD